MKKKQEVTTTSAKFKVYRGLTSAGNSHILIVVTVVDTPWQTSALAEVCFITSAVHIIQLYGPCALSKLGAGAYCHSHATAQLPAHHVGIHHVPFVVTHCAP